MVNYSISALEARIRLSSKGYDEKAGSVASPQHHDRLPSPSSVQALALLQAFDLDIGKWNSEGALRECTRGPRPRV